jgi:transposase
MRTKVNQNSFEGQEFFVGIDYHKKSWKVTILGEKYEHKSMSQDPNPDHLAAYLKKNFPGARYRAVYEAGFSGFHSCRRLNELGVECIVTHAADVPTGEKERLQKTDKADSRKLARALRGGELEGIHIPDPVQEADRALVRQRYKIMKDISRTKNRVKSLLFQFGIKIPDCFTVSQARHWSKTFIEWLRNLPVQQDTLRMSIDNYLDTGLLLRKQLLAVNRQVRALARSERYQEPYGLLTSIPGVGLMTAMNILVQIGDIGRFERFDKLSSYIGLIPSMHGSGERMTTGKLMRRGRKDIKVQLIESSWIAVRKDPAMMAKFNELTKNNMPKNKAIIRIARKLLSRMRYVLVNKIKYELGVLK